MNKVAVVIFGNEKQAYEGSRAIRDLHQEGSLTLYADAVITKDASGKMSLRRAPDTGPEGTLFGLLIGGMLGVLGGPLGMAVGAGTGTLIGAAFDLTRAGIGKDFLEEVTEFLLPGKAAVVAEIDEEWQTPLDTRMEPLGGHIFRRGRIQVEDDFFAREIAAYEAELDALDAEMAKTTAQRRAKLEAKVKETRLKLQARRDELKARIEAVKREGDAKIESLQQQIATVSSEQKERLKKRLEKVRTEYKERSAKLNEALELAKSALTP
jgi:uncharacterized membrane protein